MAILERDAQLDEISVLIDRSSDGGKIVLVRGEAGIGKTTFVRALIDRHHDRVHVLSGSCDDLLTPQPLGPIWDMAIDEPSLDAPLQQGDRRGVFSALLELLDRRLRPTLMVIEDTQWSDAATLDAIKFVGRRIRDTNGVLVLTYRDGDVGPDDALRSVIGELAAEDLVRVRISPLSEAAVRQVLEGTGHDAAEVWELTRGNPFYVTEMVREEAGSVPASVRDSVIARVAKLDRPTTELVEFVSVVPGGHREDPRRSRERPRSGEPRCCRTGGHPRREQGQDHVPSRARSPSGGGLAPRQWADRVEPSCPRGSARRRGRCATSPSRKRGGRRESDRCIRSPGCCPGSGGGKP